MMNSRIPALEAAQAAIPLDRLDGCDLLTVLMIVLDSQGTDLWQELIDNPQPCSLIWDIINATQSNPSRAMNYIRRWVRLDEAICREDLDE